MFTEKQQSFSELRRLQNTPITGKLISAYRMRDWNGITNRVEILSDCETRVYLMDVVTITGLKIDDQYQFTGHLVGIQYL